MVIGMPCDDFGQQEPGDEADIAEFCESNFHVTFPMTAKYSVMGLNAHPIFHALREEFGNDVIPRWNFHKYLFNRKGQLVEFWPSKIAPDDKSITDTIEKNLQSWTL